MVISQHAIERFRERVTPESDEAIRLFIQEDIKHSISSYTVNGVKEKRICNGIVYIIDTAKNRQKVVVTLYLI